MPGERATGYPCLSRPLAIKSHVTGTVAIGRRAMPAASTAPTALIRKVGYDLCDLVLVPSENPRSPGVPGLSNCPTIAASAAICAAVCRLSESRRRHAPTANGPIAAPIQLFKASSSGRRPAF